MLSAITHVLVQIQTSVKLVIKKIYINTFFVVYRRNCDDCASNACYVGLNRTSRCCDETCAGGCYGNGNDKCIVNFFKFFNAKLKLINLKNIKNKNIKTFI